MTIGRQNDKESIFMHTGTAVTLRCSGCVVNVLQCWPVRHQVKMQSRNTGEHSLIQPILGASCKCTFVIVFHA